MKSPYVETALPPFDLPAAELQAICARHGVKRLSLFGSALADRFRPDSDIDLLVEFKPDARVGFLALTGMQRELSTLFGRKVDLVPQDGLKPAIRAQILAEARELYAE